MQKQLKRVVSFLTALGIFCTAMPFSAAAEEVELPTVSIGDVTLTETELEQCEHQLTLPITVSDQCNILGIGLEYSEGISIEDVEGKRCDILTANGPDGTNAMWISFVRMNRIGVTEPDSGGEIMTLTVNVNVDAVEDDIQLTVAPTKQSPWGEEKGVFGNLKNPSVNLPFVVSAGTITILADKNSEVTETTELISTDASETSAVTSETTESISTDASETSAVTSETTESISTDASETSAVTSETTESISTDASETSAVTSETTESISTDASETSVATSETTESISTDVSATSDTTTATTTVEDTSGICGDVNLDGRVDILDAVLLGKAVAGAVTLNEQAKYNGDVDGEAEISSGDVIEIIRFLVHLTDRLSHSNNINLQNVDAMAEPMATSESELSIKVLNEARYYIAADARAFRVEDFVESATCDGKDIMADLCFEYESPNMFATVKLEKKHENGFYYAADNTGIYYTGDKIADIDTIYVGVKGDVNLDGSVNAMDAYCLMNYYTQHIAGNDIALLNRNEDANLETLACFLGDIDTESQPRKDSADSTLDLWDVLYIEQYAATVGAGLGTSWSEIVPVLKKLEGSCWYQ